MSYEAWGSPPAPEPTFCPACGNERHEEVNDCPLDMMYQRALAAESKNAELLAALKDITVLAPAGSLAQHKAYFAIAALQPSTQEVSK